MTVHAHFKHRPQNHGAKGARAPHFFEWGGTPCCLPPHFSCINNFYCWYFSFAWVKNSKNYDSKVQSASNEANCCLPFQLQGASLLTPLHHGFYPWTPHTPPVIGWHSWAECQAAMVFPLTFKHLPRSVILSAGIKPSSINAISVQFSSVQFSLFDPIQTVTW